MNIPNIEEISNSKSSLLDGVDVHKITEKDLNGIFGPWQKFQTTFSNRNSVRLIGSIEFLSIGAAAVTNKSGEYFTYRRAFLVSTDDLTKEQFEVLRSILKFTPQSI
jgi:hypothetical protein